MCISSRHIYLMIMNCWWLDCISSMYMYHVSVHLTVRIPRVHCHFRLQNLSIPDPGCSTLKLTKSHRLIPPPIDVRTLGCTLSLVWLSLLLLPNITSTPQQRQTQRQPVEDFSEEGGLSTSSDLSTLSEEDGTDLSPSSEENKDSVSNEDPYASGLAYRCVCMCLSVCLSVCLCS